MLLAFATVIPTHAWAQGDKPDKGGTTAPGPRVLEVDSRGTTKYKTLARAAAAVKAGDTIRLMPGSGPYREVLAIRVSGTKEQPITIDGGGNVITGFNPITDWVEQGGVVTFKLKSFPCVITYKGERLVQDATTKQFTKYAYINEAKDILQLRPGAEKEGWEVSSRDLVVAVLNQSHHIYRNIRASGSNNDGFNLHGTGTNLVFENIEGYHNLDEGYSSHDSIVSEVRSGKFWGNDNGIANSFRDRTTLSSTIIDTDVYENLGYGVSLHDCAGLLENVRVWKNGMRQVMFNKADIECKGLTVYTPAHTARVTMSYKDSQDTKQVTAYAAAKDCQITGTPPKVVEDADGPSATN